MSYVMRATCAISALVFGELPVALAQSTTQLPTITVSDTADRGGSVNPSSSGTAITVTPGAGSLTILTAEQARREIQNTPGAVAIINNDVWRDTKANTVKDMLDYVPGVWSQPKWGQDSRLSIRGSGLSRNFHGRGIQLYMDGIPINTADGYFDMQEIDPTAYKYVEVFRGANGFRFGANSMGGAINFVTPSGRDSSKFEARGDVGGFGFRRAQSSSGAAYGPFDYFVTGSWQTEDGYRDHSNGTLMRGFANVGYQLSPNVETRFYFNGNTIEQRIPGAVTKYSALNTPKTAAAVNLTNDYQRNINSNRIANKTTFRNDTTTVEVGLFNTDRHLMHPIFQWIDQTVNDYGGFGRMVDDRMIGGYRNRLVAGVNVQNGDNDSLRFTNGPGAIKGNLTYSALEKSRNTSAYVENSFYFLPNVAFVGGTQFLNAQRERVAFVGTTSGSTDFDLWSPKVGLLWDVDPYAQVFANISRSAEAPSFGEGSTFFNIPFTQIQPQRATTYEIGTRGRRPDFTWDFAVYRANIRDELQCFSNPVQTGACDVLNADRTVHQGIEAGFGAAVLKSIFANGANPDKLWLNLAYTLNDFFYDRDATWGNNILPGAPRHYFRGEMVYRHPSGFYFGPNVEWVPDSYFVDAANTMKTEPYTLFGLKGGFDNGGPYSFYVEARNLADKAYISSASIAQTANATSALFEPGTGRAIYAGARFKW